MPKFITSIFPSLIIFFCSCKEEKYYVNKDVVENYQQRERQIIELSKYYNSIVPKNKFVEIEFDDDNTLFRFGVYSIDTTTKNLILPGFLNWHLKTSSNEVDSVIKTIGWNLRTLKVIKQRLDSAKCISIESGTPSKIGFQRRDLGKYYYLIFDKPMSDSLKMVYKAGCAYNPYNDKVVFEWGAGAVGSGCYPTN